MLEMQHMCCLLKQKLTVSSNLCIWAMERPKAMLKGVKIEPGVVWQAYDKNTKIKEKHCWQYRYCIEEATTKQLIILLVIVINTVGTINSDMYQQI